MNKRLALGIAAAAIAASGFAAGPAYAEPEPLPGPPPAPTTTQPAPPGTDAESMISHCTQGLPDDQRGPAAESMRPMMATGMTGAAMGPTAMSES